MSQYQEIPKLFDALQWDETNEGALALNDAYPNVLLVCPTIGPGALKETQALQPDKIIYLQSGEWIVKDENNVLKRYTDEEFEATFNLVA